MNPRRNIDAQHKTGNKASEQDKGLIKLTNVSSHLATLSECEILLQNSKYI